MLHPFASATAMVGLTLLASVVFFTRALYGLLQAIGGWGIMPIPIGASRAESAAGAAAVLGWKVIDYPTFVMNIAWEILPTIALLHFFRSIPRSRDNLLRNMARFLFGRKDYAAVPSVLSTPTSNSGQEVLSSDNEILVTVKASNTNESSGSNNSTPSEPRRINVRVVFSNVGESHFISHTLLFSEVLEQQQTHSIFFKSREYSNTNTRTPTLEHRYPTRKLSLHILQS